jgi:hypothetical protein
MTAATPILDTITIRVGKTARQATQKRPTRRRTVRPAQRGQQNGGRWNPNPSRPLATQEGMFPVQLNSNSIKTEAPSLTPAQTAVILQCTATSEAARPMILSVPGSLSQLEAQQVLSYYDAAAPLSRGITTGLLQTEVTPRALPLMLAFSLAMELLGNEEEKARQQGQEDGEGFPEPDEVAAGFWRGVVGFAEFGGADAAKETPESERGTITSAARVLFGLSQTTTAGAGMPSELEADVLAAEATRPDQWGAGVSECEYSFLSWLQHGTPLAAVYSDPDFILDSLDPASGGSTLEKVNRINRVWWLSMRRLQARLLEFAALEIPEPQEITEADVEAMRRDLEEPAPEEFTITQAEALALVRPEALARFLAIKEASKGREWTGEEFAALCEYLTPEGRERVRGALAGDADIERHLSRV